jgi:Tfp pilus assembly protein PilF
LVARLLGNLGNLSLNQGEFGQAHQYYHRQLAVAKNAGIRNSVAWVQMNLAQLQIRQGD